MCAIVPIYCPGPSLQHNYGGCTTFPENAPSDKPDPALSQFQWHWSWAFGQLTIFTSHTPWYPLHPVLYTLTMQSHFIIPCPLAMATWAIYYNPTFDFARNIYVHSHTPLCTHLFTIYTLPYSHTSHPINYHTHFLLYAQTPITIYILLYIYIIP